MWDLWLGYFILTLPSSMVIAVAIYWLCKRFQFRWQIVLCTTLIVAVAAIATCPLYYFLFPFLFGEKVNKDIFNLGKIYIFIPIFVMHVFFIIPVLSFFRVPKAKEYKSILYIYFNILYFLLIPPTILLMCIVLLFFIV